MTRMTCSFSRSAVHACAPEQSNHTLAKTIGPAPMIRMLWMSVLLGMVGRPLSISL